MSKIETPLVLSFGEDGADDPGLVGGKAASLTALREMGDVRVPDGFVVTTAGYSLGHTSGNTDEMPDEVVRAIGQALDGLLQRHDGGYLAVRSSATAEDQPTASFAGLYDSYLNVPPTIDAVLDRVRDCWASLHNERAIAYRRNSGDADADAAMAVIVQSMVDADAAGVMFTADPLTGKRTVTTIEAVPGLGDPLVGGEVDTHRWSTIEVATQYRPPASVDETPPLTDSQVADLTDLGRRIEAKFGHPQDIEWCLDAEGFHIVQTRPITTLFPIPTAEDDAHRVYISVGHQQMMTDAMAPLGLSIWQLTALRPMVTAGGRLFVDATENLTDPSSRQMLVNVLGRSDPLVQDALETVLASGFLGDPDRTPVPEATEPPAVAPHPAPPIANDPQLVIDLIAKSRESIARLTESIRGRSGSALLDFIEADIAEMKALLIDPTSHQVLMAGMEATWWLNDHLQERLGIANGADALAQSAPGNITSEMGLALLDVADAIRSYPTVIDHLRTHGTLDGLASVHGGVEAQAAIDSYLREYGMRCVGEIDITRPRWAERPSALVPMILANVDHFTVGAREQRFADGAEAATRVRHEVLTALRALPEGAADAAETDRYIERLRMFIGYREFPKYMMVSRYWIYKQALLTEADRLVRAGALDTTEDIFYLTMPELRGVIEARSADRELIASRRADLVRFASLRVPRVLTSEGEMLDGSYGDRDAPAGALLGMAASAGLVEGRARVLSDASAVELEPGDILVTAHTDPSWSPLFVSAAGLVTRVGGLMSHGSVIAREYGLPAVVGVADATTRICDGQRIRLNGTAGYVELLD